MRSDNCARTFAIDVKIADVEFLNRAVNLLLRIRIDRPGEAEFGVVRNFQCVIKVLGLDDRQHRAKDFFLFQS